ncbi:Sulfur carrier protein ThiS (thiamine biosynthesis) [Propionivibrio dicarboxylicus]|uniref:Sulfur carrier protein ThiS (Thiamine biosynthesis) n=2 Tax=Propionivibrio dicarboxylicus TaxID=83767 RepID=A0A1G7V9P5_9RHOO|nr:Sulfur carrier protein ThiS (thiamine biosynthesis) [Propionivibrio dicarboxylicus]
MAAMNIRLRLFATLRDYLPPGASTEVPLELPDTATVADALTTLGVPLNLAHIAFVNGRHVLKPDLATRVLQSGDVVSVFPAIGGG